MTLGGIQSRGVVSVDTPLCTTAGSATRRAAVATLGCTAMRSLSPMAGLSAARRCGSTAKPGSPRRPRT